VGVGVVEGGDGVESATEEDDDGLGHGRERGRG
jgi:hypothetical protein